MRIYIISFYITIRTDIHALCFCMDEPLFTLVKVVDIIFYDKNKTGAN